MNNNYIAYTDGSCNNLSRRREGGAAYIILQDDEIIKQASKGFVGTTNNRMEILAIISAVNALPVKANVSIYTDSQYAISVLSNRKKKQKLNMDLITLFRKVSYKLNNIEFHWVKGHIGNKYNELVDNMAYEQYKLKSKEKNQPKILGEIMRELAVNGVDSCTGEVSILSRKR
jgi:ribonuclease HI